MTYFWSVPHCRAAIQGWFTHVTHRGDTETTACNVAVFEPVGVASVFNVPISISAIVVVVICFPTVFSRFLVDCWGVVPRT